ncbi:hypothetical protein DAEQUDRAFT_758250 [Daedalea quercina L-15889]|uniref:F-box domain-containing protein n=1 Tax=Daedalea quercina L-15889 TaxID=1314783 RepID=A0A165NQA7_9APHY|nr:hypothetical protein DAEQUDRAFT_758250 [Daedalea quercina L-15889]
MYRRSELGTAPQSDREGACEGNNGIERLPQELWDNILSRFDGDRITLKACSLTCSAWADTARKLRWRNLSVPGGPWRPEIPSRLRSFLAEEPDIAGLVSTMRVALPIKELPWAATFANLTELQLKPIAHDAHDPADTAIGGLRLSNITTLVLSWYDPPSAASFVKLLACFPRLSVLKVHGCDPESLKLERLQRETLPSTPLSLLRLRKLVFDSSGLVQALPLITRSAGASLESVKLRVLTIPVSRLPDVLDFSRNLQLAEVEFIISCWPHCHAWGACLATALSQINTSHTNLTRFILSPRNPPGGWVEPNQALGRELCRVLDDLPNVTLTIRMWEIRPNYGADEMRRDLESHFQRNFPGLIAHPQRLRFTGEFRSVDAEPGKERRKPQDVPLI